MKRCYHCKRRILMWQRKRLWFKHPGPSVYLHDNCDTAYDAGYALGKERGIKEGKEQGGALESLAEAVKPCPIKRGDRVKVNRGALLGYKGTFTGLHRNKMLMVKLDDAKDLTGFLEWELTHDR